MHVETQSDNKSWFRSPLFLWQVVHKYHFGKSQEKPYSFSKWKRRERPKNLFEVKILLDTGLYSKNAQLSSLAFLFLVLPYNPHKLDWLFASVPHSIQVVPKKALYFLSIWAQSRCDPDLDHISIGPGLTKTVFWDTL